MRYHRLVVLCSCLVAWVSEVRAHAPSALVFVVDVSRSMLGPGVDLARGEMAEVPAQLERTDLVGLVTFDDSAMLAAALEPPGWRFTRAVEQLAPGRGGTDVLGGLARGIEVLEPIHARYRKHIILFTDAVAHVSGITTLAERARAGRITVTVVGLGRERHAELLRAATQTTGGRYVVLRSHNRGEVVRDELVALRERRADGVVSPRAWCALRGCRVTYAGARIAITDEPRVLGRRAEGWFEVADPRAPDSYGELRWRFERIERQRVDARTIFIIHGTGTISEPRFHDVRSTRLVCWAEGDGPLHCPAPAFAATHELRSEDRALGWQTRRFVTTYSVDAHGLMLVGEHTSRRVPLW